MDRQEPLAYIHRSGKLTKVERIEKDAVKFALGGQFYGKKTDFADKLLARLQKSGISLYTVEGVDHPVLFYSAIVIQIKSNASLRDVLDLVNAPTSMKITELCFARKTYLLHNFRSPEQAGHVCNFIEERNFVDDTLIVFAELQYSPTPTECLIDVAYSEKENIIDLPDETYIFTLGLNGLSPKDKTIEGNSIAVIDSGFYEMDSITWPPVNNNISGFFDGTGSFHQEPKKIPHRGHGIMCSELVMKAASRNNVILLASADRYNFAPPIAVAIAIAYSARHDCLSEWPGGADVVVCSLRDSDTRLGAGRRSIQLAVEYANNYGREGKGTPVFWAAADYSSSGEISSLPEVIAVGATDQQGNGSVGTRDNNEMDFSAPGKAITIDRYTGTGTSFAAPLAAGLAARILSNYPDLNHLELRAILRLTCVKLKGYDYVNDRSSQIGYGLLNYPAALELAGQYDRKERPYVDRVNAMVCQIQTDLNANCQPT